MANLAQIARLIIDEAEKDGVSISDYLIDVENEVSLASPEFSSYSIGYGLGYDLNLLDIEAYFPAIGIKDLMRQTDLIVMDGNIFLELLYFSMYANTIPLTEVDITNEG